jgi:hypothetical protein
VTFVCDSLKAPFLTFFDIAPSILAQSLCNLLQIVYILQDQTTMILIAFLSYSDSTTHAKYSHATIRPPEFKAAPTLTLNTEKIKAIDVSCAAAMMPEGQDVITSLKRILTDGASTCSRTNLYICSVSFTFW